MENTTGGGTASRPVDPAGDLDILNRAKASVDADLFLDFGPWWYAPLLATTIGGLSLFDGGESTSTSVLLLLVGLLAGTAMSVHGFRGRAVRPRASVRGALFFLPIIVISWLAVAAWGTALSSLGYERFVPGYALLGWLLTTGFFLALRSGLYAIRRRRRSLA